MRIHGFVLFLIAGLSGNAAFGGLADRYLRGCAQYVTVQGRSCEVEQLWRCPDAKTGPLRSVIYNDEGLAGVMVMDEELRLLEMRRWPSGTRHVLHNNSADLNTLSEFLENGEDTYDVLMQDQRRRRNGLHFVGKDILTDEVREIDGVLLRETRFDYVLTVRNGRKDRKVHTFGTQYYSEKYGYIFAGPTQREKDGETETDDNSPFVFADPGEAGFEKTTPIFGCGEVVHLLRKVG